MGARDAWARRAINFVGESHDWMRDFRPLRDGTYPFKPHQLETRKHLARAVVKAFAPHAAGDPSIRFRDLDRSQTFYRWANVAVAKGWMSRTADNRFLPGNSVSMTTVHRVLVLALGMRGTARRLDRLRTRDGDAVRTPRHFGSTNLGMRLGLRYPSSEDDHDVTPRTPLSRAQVAYSLYKAKTLASWVVPWIGDQYGSVELPKMSRTRTQIVQWGLKYVGYPYAYGAEWGFESPAPAAFGGQRLPGFDCSGLMWWLARGDDGASWNISPPRPYRGWDLPQRSSADMARVGRIRWKELLPGDLAFYDGNGDRTVDHVDLYVGNGYALDASTSVGGTTLMYVGPGSWYRDHFVHGRRLLPTK